jgi:integrase
MVSFSNERTLLTRKNCLTNPTDAGSLPASAASTMKKLIKIKRTRTGRYSAVHPTPFGRRSTRLADCSTRAEAEAMVKVLDLERKVRLAVATDKSEVAALGNLLVGRRLTMNEAVTEWREANERARTFAPATLMGYHVTLLKWVTEGELDHASPATLRPEHIGPFVNPESDIKVATRRGRLAAISAFFDWAMSAGLCFRNPAAAIRRVATRDLPVAFKEVRARQVFTAEEEDCLIAGCDRHIDAFRSERDFITSDLPAGKQGRARCDARIARWIFCKVAIVLGCHVGLRIGDIAALEWDQLIDDRLVCWTRKRDRRVEVPLDDSTKLALGWIVKRDERFCFPEQAAMENDPARRHALAMQFIRLRKQCGIADKNFHDTRSTYVSRLVASGVPIEVAKTLVGHASATTTKGYAVNEKGQ